MKITNNMTALNIMVKRLAVAATVVGLVACGGGGSSSTPPVQTSVTVTPALGGFSSGAAVTAINPSGTTIASGTTGSSGSATLNFAGYSGPFTLVVTGGPSVTYYDEKSGTNLPFAATDSLLSVVPATTIKSGVSYGVTSLTNMAAAFAGVTKTGVIAGSTDAVNTALTNAVAKTQLTIGIPADQVNILSAPKAVTSTTPKLSGTTADVTYGLILAELANSAITTALAQANGLATSAAAVAVSGSAITGAECLAAFAKMDSIMANPTGLGANYGVTGTTAASVTFTAPKATVTNEEVATAAAQVKATAPQGTTTPVTGASN